MNPKIKKYFSDPLYKNSFFILLNTFSGALFGILFWMLAARFYSSEDIGLATALLSSTGIIVSLSSFGLSTGLLRFLPESVEKSSIFNTVWIISIASVFVFSLVFLLGMEFISQPLKFLMGPGFILIFILFMLFQVSAGLVNVGLLTFRKAEYSFAQNLGLGFRIPLLIPLAFGGVMGIFGSMGIAIAISFGIGLLMLHKQGLNIKPVFRRRLINDIMPYSLANYVSDFLMTAQTSILPIIILNVIGVKETAYFYVSFSIASLLYAVPNSIFMSMFIEGSHGEPLRRSVIKSLAAVGAVLLPVGVVVYLFGNFLLYAFSKEYSQNAYEILKLLVLASVFVVFNALFVTVKKIQKDTKPLIAVNGLLLISIVVFSYIFMLRYGLFGVGLGWISGQGVTSVVIGMNIWKEEWR